MFLVLRSSFASTGYCVTCVIFSFHRLKSRPLSKIMAEEPSVEQLPLLLKEWMQGEAELKALSAEVREKRKRIGAVRSMISTIMKQGKIGKLNISTGAVINRSKQTKGSFTKKFIVTALTDFFKGDAKKAAECAAFLEQHRPIKNTETLSLEPT